MDRNDPKSRAQVRILNERGHTAGCGFLIDARRIMTCAHVVAGLPPATIGFTLPLISDEVFCARLALLVPENEHAQPGEPEDIAVLEVPPDQTLPEAAQPAPVTGPGGGKLKDRLVNCFGIPELMDKEGSWVRGRLAGTNGRGHVQIDTMPGHRSIEHGFSGTPAWDAATDEVLGMVVGKTDKAVTPASGYMIPSATLRRAYADLPPVVRKEGGWKWAILAVLLLFLAALIGVAANLYFTGPRFAVETPRISPGDVIIFTAKNRAANREGPLDVRFDGQVFERRGLPMGRDADGRRRWGFDINRDYPHAAILEDGEYTVNARFPGKRFLDENQSRIEFDTGLDVKVASIKTGEDERTLIAKGTRKKDQAIHFDITLYHEGEANRERIPVTTRQDPKTGVVYFEFEHIIKVHGAPTDDAGRSRKFFEMEVSDETGRCLYHEALDYAGFMSKSSRIFGLGEYANIAIDRPDPEATEGGIFQKEVLTITPAPRFQPTDGGEPLIQLTATEHIKNYRELRFTSEVENGRMPFYILRDGEQIGTTEETTFVDAEPLAESEIEYRVEQENADGERFSSNTATVRKPGDVIDGPLAGMRFAWIPPGTFMMGSPEGEPGRFDDETQHKVTLTFGFYMQTTEVTQDQWTAVMGENPAYFKNCGGDCPVENVSWNEVQEFINKLNAKGARKYRLPTEAEWEYAARAGTTTAFANGGITELSCGLDPNLDKMGWYCGNSDSKTHPVGQKDANAWALFDMHGNVWEWCEDTWHDNYKGAPADGSAWVDKSQNAARVLRGGSWDFSARLCRAAHRLRDEPGNRDSHIGFRLVRASAQY